MNSVRQLRASSKSIGPAAVSFVEWVAPQLLESRCALASFPRSGTGLVATEPLEAGQVVLRVPQHVWFPCSALYARHQAQRGAPHFMDAVASLARQALGRAPGADASLLSNVGAIVGSAAVGDGPSSESADRAIANLESSILLAMNLLFEMGDQTSSMKPWLDFIASSVPVDSSPLFWALDEVGGSDGSRGFGSRLSLISGCRALPAAQRRAAGFRSIHAALFGASTGEPGGVASGPSLTQFVFALNIILSRAVSHRGMLFTIVPLLDCLNHDPTPSCRHRVDDEKSFVVETVRPHEAGEQLFLCYNDLGNDALLRLYGFTLRNNPNDFVPLPEPEWVRRPPGSVLSGAATVLRARDCSTGPISDSVLTAMLAQTQSPVDACARLQRPIEAALNQYAGGAGTEADAALLDADADAEVDVKLQDWERACIALRLGEKGILRAALGQLKTLDWASLESNTE